MIPCKRTGRHARDSLWRDAVDIDEALGLVSAAGGACAEQLNPEQMLRRRAHHPKLVVVELVSRGRPRDTALTMPRHLIPRGNLALRALRQHVRLVLAQLALVLAARALRPLRRGCRPAACAAAYALKRDDRQRRVGIARLELRRRHERLRVSRAAHLLLHDELTAASSRAARALRE
eukprot:5084431-Pleurochrysis_carterae.AAC.1